LLVLIPFPTNSLKCSLTFFKGKRVVQITNDSKYLFHLMVSLI
jgi:hypothetical protein